MKGKFLVLAVHPYDKGEEVVFSALNTEDNDMMPCGGFSMQFLHGSKTIGTLVAGKTYELSINESI